MGGDAIRILGIRAESCGSGAAEERGEFEAADGGGGGVVEGEAGGCGGGGERGGAFERETVDDGVAGCAARVGVRGVVVGFVFGGGGGGRRGGHPTWVFDEVGDGSADVGQGGGLFGCGGAAGLRGRTTHVGV